MGAQALIAEIRFVKPTVLNCSGLLNGASNQRGRGYSWVLSYKDCLGRMELALGGPHIYVVGFKHPE